LLGVLAAILSFGIDLEYHAIRSNAVASSPEPAVHV